MPLPFNQYNWLQIQDIRRCPFSHKSEYSSWIKWNNNEDERLLILALERYARALRYDAHIQMQKVPK